MWQVDLNTSAMLFRDLPGTLVVLIATLNFD